MIGKKKMSKNVGLPADGQQNSGGTNVKIVRITTPSNIKIQPVGAEKPAPQPSGETFVHRPPEAITTVAPTISAAVTPVETIVLDPTPDPKPDTPVAAPQKSGATPKLVGLAVGLCAVIAIMLVIEATRGGDSEEVASQTSTTPDDIVAALKPTSKPVPKPTPLSVQTVKAAEPVRKPEPTQRAVIVEETVPATPVRTALAEIAPKVAVTTPAPPQPEIAETVDAPATSAVTPKPSPADIIATAPKPGPAPAPTVEDVTPVIAVKPSEANDDIVALITSGTLAALRGGPSKPLDHDAN